jgi:flagellar biosynthetic protein FliQ
VAFHPARRTIVSGPEVLDIARDGIWTLILVSAPPMLVGLFVGVIIALVQALTQIQEMTLVFVPKIIAIFVATVVAMPFMGQAMGGYMDRIVDNIVGF